MAKYRVEVTRTAERQLGKLPKLDQVRVVKVIFELASDPFPKGSRKLTGYEDVYRIRIGRYRILYSVSQKTLIIIVLKVGHRKDVYR